MGNELAAIVPAQILPIEQHLTELKDHEFQKSLGSTRFLKVARVRNATGNDLVVKVFAVLERPLPLKDYLDSIDRQSSLLRNCSNCLPYSQTVLTDKAALVTRRFCKHNLYDRLSTRPFLNDIERRWIAFGILSAIAQAHEMNVFHGDIKTENILLSSSNHIFLCDWASEFKPIYIPDKSPSDFDYFFDTSRRRTCYLAPERFFESEPPTNPCLTYEMDIFSAGCVFIELFTDGQIPFTLTKLLAFRSRGKKYDPEEVISRIEDAQIRHLVRNMTNIDKNQRLTAQEYLDKEYGKTFPKSFYEFFPNYAKSLPVAPDTKVQKLNDDLEKFLLKTLENDSLVLCVPLVTSCIRSVRMVSSRLSALAFLKKISIHLSSDLVLDRIIPFILQLLDDVVPRVRAESIYVLTDCIENCKLPDSNVLPNYVLIKVRRLTNDEAPIVRLTLARCLCSLAESCLRFLECAADTDSNISFDLELGEIRDSVAQIATQLLRDSQPEVRQTMALGGAAMLCSILGRKLAADVLLSHMITFLNERQWRTRLAFFKSLVQVAVFVGVQASDVVTPLISSGMRDAETLVIQQALKSGAVLVEHRLLKKTTMYDLLNQSVIPLLSHPSLCIRYAACSFVCAVSRTLHPADIHCCIFPKLEKKLETKSAVYVEKEHLLLTMLKPPISRDILEMIQKSQDPQKVIEAIRAKKFSHSITSLESSIEKKLLRFEMNEHTTDSLIELKSFFGRESSESSSDLRIGEVDLKNIMGVSPRHVTLVKLKREGKKIRDAAEGLGSMNEDWKQMFGGSAAASFDTTAARPLRHSTEVKALGKHDHSEIPAKTPCQNDLQQLVRVRRKQIFNSGLLLEDSKESKKKPPKDWKPKGLLVGHTHEHRGSVNALRMSPDSSCLASASTDGTIRLWKCSKMAAGTSSGTTIRSQSSYSHQGGQIRSVAFSASDQFASISNNGTLHVVSIASDKLKCTKEYDMDRSIDVDTDGMLTDLTYIPSCQAYLFSTVHGLLQAIDTRSPVTALKLEQEPEMGLITSIAPSQLGEWWLATGTIKGIITIWDLRFLLPISTIKSPAKNSIKKILAHPSDRAKVAVAYSGNNEVSVWNLEGSNRDMAIWASPAAPLSVQKTNAHSIWGMHLGVHDVSNDCFILTGGTDMRLRYWNLNKADSCCIFTKAGHDRRKNLNATYQHKLIEGTNVIQEVYAQEQTEVPNRLGTPAHAMETPPVGHHDIVTDIAACRIADHNLVFSSSRDGVVKVWK